MNLYEFIKSKSLNESQKCPKCGGVINGFPAISRFDNKTEICSDCGTTEAIENMSGIVVDPITKKEYTIEEFKKLKQDEQNEDLSESSEDPFAPKPEDWDDINHWFNDNPEEEWDKLSKVKDIDYKLQQISDALNNTTDPNEKEKLLKEKTDLLSQLDELDPLNESAEDIEAFWNKDFKIGDKVQSSGAGEVEILDMNKDKNYILIKRNTEYDPFVAAWAPQYSNEKISWGQGHYYDDEKPARDYFNSLNETDNYEITGFDKEDELEKLHQEDTNKDLKEYQDNPVPEDNTIEVSGTVVLEAKFSTDIPKDWNYSDLVNNIKDNISDYLDISDCVVVDIDTSYKGPQDIKDEYTDMQIDENLMNESEDEFNPEEFEKLIPYNMRFKVYKTTESDPDIPNNCLYWVTQAPFNKTELEQFQEALKSTPFTSAYVTLRDLSGYDFLHDKGKDVLAEIGLNNYNANPYINAVAKIGFDFNGDPYKSPWSKNNLKENQKFN